MQDHGERVKLKLDSLM